MVSSCSLLVSMILHMLSIHGWLTVECGSLSSPEDNYRRKSSLTGYAEVFQIIASELSGTLEKSQTCSLLCLSWTAQQKEWCCFWREALYYGEINSMFSLIWIPRWLSDWITSYHWSNSSLHWNQNTFPRTRCYLAKSV